MSEYRSLDAIHEIMQKENAKKIFLVTGKTSFEKSGAKDRLDLSDVTQFSDYEPNPKIEDIRQGIELFREQNCDVVLAIGGGSTIDVAKAINIIGSHAGDPEPYVKKEREFEHRGKPFIAVPTTSGSGSEATHFAVIYINGKKYSLAHPEYLLPDYVLLDYTLTMSMPKNVTASSGMDAIAQATEAYWSVNSNDESREYSRRAILLALEHIQDAVNDPTAEARIGMQNAANLAGKAINITKTTAPHAASYALTTYHGIPHGHAVGLTLGEFFVFNEGVSEDDVWDERGCAAVQKAIGELVEIYGVKDAGEANLFLKRLMESIGLDTKLSSFGVTEANLQRLIDAVNFERLKNNPRRVQKEDLEEIYLRVL